MMLRVRALVTAGLITLVAAPAAAAQTTAWSRHGFDVDTANLVRRSNVVLERPPALATQSMPLGNGRMGAAVWADEGFTAQLNRTDTYPTRRSPGQVVIPGLERMTAAPDYRATVDLYDAVYRQSGGGMTATTFISAAEDTLVVNVTGADPAATQTARGQPPGRPQPAGGG